MHKSGSPYVGYKTRAGEGAGPKRQPKRPRHARNGSRRKRNIHYCDMRIRTQTQSQRLSKSQATLYHFVTFKKAPSTPTLAVSRGKTYRYQKFLCTTGSQICQAGLRYTLVCPAWHCLCVRAPTPRFRAAAPTCGGIYHRASHAALPGFPAPPHNHLRAPQSCRHCQPCACDVR